MGNKRASQKKERGRKEGKFRTKEGQSGQIGEVVWSRFLGLAQVSDLRITEENAETHLISVLNDGR